MEKESPDDTKAQSVSQNKVGAKAYSLISQITASIWIAGWSAFNFIAMIKASNHIAINDIVISGIGVAACFSPVYLSILFDKVKDIKSA